MKKSLIIDLANLPEDGIAAVGEIDGSIFDLSENDARAETPLRYDLWIQRFDNELLATGSLSASFSFTCVITLKEFIQTIELTSAAVSIEIEKSGLIDLTEALREELILEFPADPRCDEGDNPEPCEIDTRYLAIDKTAESGLPPASREGSDDRWSALNDLKGLNDQP